MSSKCCNYTTLCDDNGNTVLARLTIEKGLLVVKKWNLDSSLNEEGLLFNGCPSVPITNLIDLGIRMNPLSCVAEQLSTTFSFEVQNNLTGIVDGSTVQFSVSFSNNLYYDYEIELYDDNFIQINKNTIKIVNASLFNGYINNIKIKFMPLTCAPVTITMAPTGIYDVAPSYGTGNLAGDSKTKT